MVKNSGRGWSSTPIREHFPHAGKIVLFDRSWYNRAMVEPIMGFCTRKQYRDFIDKVNGYEESFVADGQTSLIKLYFSVSKKEQKRGVYAR